MQRNERGLMMIFQASFGRNFQSRPEEILREGYSQQG